MTSRVPPPGAGLELGRPRATEITLADDPADESPWRHGFDRLGLHITNPASSHEGGIVDDVPHPLRRCGQDGGTARDVPGRKAELNERSDDENKDEDDGERGQEGGDDLHGRTP